MSGKAKGQKYPMFTHSSGLVCASLTQAKTNGCPDVKPMKRRSKGEPATSEEDAEET